MSVQAQLPSQFDDSDAGILSYLLAVNVEEVDDDFISRYSLQDIKLAIEEIQRLLDGTGSGDGLKLPGNPQHKQHRSQYIRALIKLVGTFEILPEDIYVSGLECDSWFPSMFGAYSDVFTAKWPTSADPQQSFAVKRRPESIIGDDGCANRETIIEAVLCRQFRHEHIMDFLGVERELFAPTNALVSPWMENGNLMAYLKHQTLPASPVNRLLLEVASGLQYLHDQSIIHGDLRAANILISDSQHARIGGFHSAATAIAHSVGVDGIAVALPKIRWLAPENLNCDRVLLTEHSDVYSFGCVCLEAYILKPPYWYLREDAHVIVRRLCGHRMLRPTSAECPGPLLSDSLWLLLSRCWDKNPDIRPTLSLITQTLSSSAVDGPGA